MSVTNGQKANASTFNNAFLSRTQDSDTVGRVGLKNSDVSSGNIINNAQKAINKAFEGLGCTGEDDTTVNNYSSTNYISNGDSRKTAISKLDNKAKQLQDDLDVCEADIASLDTRLDNAENDIASLDTRLDNAESDIVSLDTRLDNAESDIASLDTRLDSVETDISSFDSRLDSLESGNMTIDGNKTFIGNVIVSGDFTANGNTTFINSTELNVADSFITLNKGGTDASAEGSGIEIERPSGNAGIVFDSNIASRWKIGIAGNLREVLVSGVAQSISGVKTFLSGIKTDTITENSANAGVTVEGVLIKNGLVSGRNISTDGNTLDSLSSTVSSLNTTVNSISNSSFTFNGNKTFSNSCTFSSSAIFNNEILLTSSANTQTGSNVTISPVTSPLIRLTGSLTSIAGISSQTSNRVIFLLNATASVVTIVNDSVAQTNERIRTGTGSNVIMPSNCMAQFIYDITSTRWYLIGIQSVGGGGSTSDNTFEFNLNGEYGVASVPVNGVDGIRVFPFSSRIKNVFIYQLVAGSGGTTELDIKVKPFGSGTFTSIFSTTPKVTPSAGSFNWCGVGDAVTGFTAPVLSTNPFPVSSKSAVRMDLLSVQSGTPAGVGLVLVYEPDV